MAKTKWRKLSKAERSEWKARTKTAYKDSPLKAVMPKEAYGLICRVCKCAVNKDFYLMLRIIANNAPAFARYEGIPEFRALLKRAYEYGVACGDAACCCDLANMYHKTDNTGTPEEYATAIELYELGVDRGDVQASINLGYIYYYGRGTSVDYAKAYECFARGAFMNGHPEGYWKLGDLYAGGRGVRKSDPMAWKLYSQAYKNADGGAIGCRAAHHMADYLLKGIKGELSADPDRALKLYNEAELGYYVLIDAGATYYQTQLKECIAGQKKARKLVQKKHAKLRAGKK